MAGFHRYHRLAMTTAPSPAARVRFHSIVWPLAIAETIVWAAMYYAFPALLPAWERDLGWSKTELSFAFTLSLVVSASLVPVAGRLIDRGLARSIFTGGTVLGAVLLALLSLVTEPWQFVCIWIGLGVAMSGTLYEACFAVLVRSTGDRARRAITIVSVVAGLAGTVAFPSAHLLAGAFGWRGAVLVFAAVVGTVAVPLVWSACRRAEAQAAMHAPVPSASAARALAVVRTPAFWLLAIAIFLAALDHGMLISHVLPILDDRGIDAGLAVVAASFIGPMQVAGRLALIAADRFAGTLMASTGCFAMMAIAGLCLLDAGAAPALLVGFVVLQGAGIGVASVMRPVVTAELLGRRNFGVVSGLVGLMHMSGYALGPSVSALVWSSGGYDRVILLAIAAAVVAIAALLAAWRGGGPGRARGSQSAGAPTD
ncbi:MAG: MFS transporter [Gammaproteobacteria bacterium]|nr:MFS transporter [Gammaproteobacteria bacterium]